MKAPLLDHSTGTDPHHLAMTDLLPPSSPLFPLAAELSATFGLGSISSLAVVLCGISACSGPLARLNAPCIGTISSSLFAVAFGPGSARLARAFSTLAGKLRQKIYADVAATRSERSAIATQIQSDLRGGRKALGQETSFRNSGAKQEALKGHKGDTVTRDFHPNLDEALCQQFHLLHPLKLVEPLWPDQFPPTADAGGNFSFDAQGLALDRLLRKSRKARETYGQTFSAMLDGRPELAEHQPLVHPGCSSLSVCSGETVAGFFSDDVLSGTGLPQRSLYLPVAKMGTPDYSAGRLEFIADEFERLLGWMLPLRHGWRHEVVHFSTDAQIRLKEVLTEAEDLEQASPGLSDFIYHFPAQVCRAALLLHLAESRLGDGGISASHLATAHRLVSHLWQHFAPVLQAQRGAPFQRLLDVRVEALAEKVRNKGPLTWRDLMRSYHSISKAELHTLVEHASQRGMVRTMRGLILPAREIDVSAVCDLPTRVSGPGKPQLTGTDSIVSASAASA